MDWRSGGRQPPGSGFRGMPLRGRGRGRGRGGGSISRASAVNSPTSVPTATPSTPGPSLTNNIPVKSPARRGPNQGQQKSIPLNGFNTSKTTPSNELPANTPPLSRRTSQNTVSSSVADAPDSSPARNPPRPKASRKRSHNRGKASKSSGSQGQSSAAPSLPSLSEKQAATPSAPSAVRESSTRTDIDALVERVRAMAMAGSAIERNKEKEEPKEEAPTLPNDHIDWAGEFDDSLPDLDDWVKPKVNEESKGEVNGEPAAIGETGVEVELKEVEEVVPETSDKSPVQLLHEESGVHGTNAEVAGTAVNSLREDAVVKAADTLQGVPVVAIDPTKGVSAEGPSESIASTVNAEHTSIPSGKAKVRGRHGRKRTAGQQELNSLSSGTGDAVVSTVQHSNGVQSSMVHPLPPKPEVSFPPRAPLSKNPGTPESIRKSLIGRIRHDSKLQAAASAVFSKNLSGGSAATDARAQNGENDGVVAQSSTFEEAQKVPENAQASQSPLPTTDNTTVDSAPRIVQDKDGWIDAASSDPFIDHSKPANGDSRFPSHNRYCSPTPFIPRSQGNSPRKFRYADGIQSHQRTRSSPQARTHSRPIISEDALSRLSRTLGAASVNTSPRKPHIELTAVDQANES